MDRSDLYRQVGALHARSLDQGFLATMGVDFLALMYRAIDEAPDSVLFTECQAGELVGFVSGGIGMAKIYRRMLVHPFRLARAMVPCLLSLRRWRKVLEVLHYSRGGSQRDLPQAELLSIAVAPAWRGQQVAERLYLRLMKHFREHDVPAFKITVGEALAPAHRFYRRMGAVPVAQVQVHNGERSQIYLHRLV